MKRLSAIICWLLLATQALAGITYHGDTGQTVYARVQTGPTTFKGVAMTEGTNGGLGVYAVTDAALLSAGITVRGEYPFTVRSGTASDTANDTILAGGSLSWSGTSEITVAGGEQPSAIPVLVVSSSADGNLTYTTATNTVGQHHVRVNVNTVPGASQSEATPYDTYNNTFTLIDADVDANTACKSWVFDCVNPATGPAHIIYVSTASKSPSIAAVFLPDVLLPSPIDQASTATPATGTSTQGGSITPSEDDCWVVSFVATVNAGGDNVAVTGQDAFASIDCNELGNNIGNGVSVTRQTTATAFNPTWTHNNAWHIGRNYSFKASEVDVPAIYANEFPNKYVEKVNADYLSADVTIAGAFAYQSAPARVRIQWYEAGGEEIAKPYTELKDLLLGSGVFSGQAEAPAGGPWNYQLQALDAQGNIIATSEQTRYYFYGGLRVAIAGQSNAQRLFDAYAGVSETADAGTIQFDDEGWGDFTATAPAIRLANQLQETSGLPVALFKVAIPGSALTADPGNGAGYWLDRDEDSPWGKMIISTAFAKPRFNAFVYAAGEADVSIAATGQAFTDGVLELSNRVNQLQGGKIPFILPNISKIDDYEDADATAIRVAQAEIPDREPWLFHGGNRIDGTLVDEFHEDGPSYVRDCNRYAQACAFALGFTEESARGPQALNAWRYSGSNKIYVNTTAKGLEQLSVGVPTGITIYGNASPLTISSVAYSGGTIEFTLSAVPADNVTIVIDNLVGKTPTTTRLIYGTDYPGNDTRGIPLLPFEAMTVALRDQQQTDDLITTATLPFWPRTSVGYKLKDRSGTQVQSRTTDNVSIVSLDERKRTAVFASYGPRPSDWEGISQWDNTEQFVVDDLAISSALNGILDSGANGFDSTEKAQILAALSVGEDTGVTAALTWRVKRIDGQMKATASVAKDADEDIDVLADFRDVLAEGDAIKPVDQGGIVSIGLINDGNGGSQVDSDAFDDVDEATLWMNSGVRFRISGGTVGQTDRIRVKVITVDGQTLSVPCSVKVTDAGAP